MQIKIKQKKIRIGYRYEIYMERKETHFTSTETFRGLSEIELFKNGSDGPRYVIRENRALFKTSYDLTRWDNSILEFRTKSAWKGHYFCSDGQDYYEIFSHRGWKCSVFRNDNQIAYWDGNTDPLVSGDKYIIFADSDADFELLMAFCLVLDNRQSTGSDGAGVAIDFGNIGKEARKFDENWQPK
jgi:hypothetical protein